MIYLFYGDFSLVNFEAEDKIEELQKANPGQFEIRKVDLEKEKINTFLSQPTISFFGNLEINVVYHGENLSRELITNLIQNYKESDERHLIILAGELKPPHPLLKPEFLKNCKEARKIVFNENWLRKKIQAEFRKHGKEVSNKLLEVLINLYGSNLNLIKQEAKKIALYFARHNKISSQELKLLLSESTENLTLKLFKALSQKDKKQVLKLLAKMFTYPSEAPIFISQVLSRLRLWLKVRVFTVEGVTDYKTIAKKLNLNPYYIRHLINESNNFSCQELEKALLEGLKLDYLLKTGKIEQSAAPIILLEKIFQLWENSGKAD